MIEALDADDSRPAKSIWQAIGILHCPEFSKKRLPKQTQAALICTLAIVTSQKDDPYVRGNTNNDESRLNDQ